MGELWELYDEKRRKIGKDFERNGAEMLKDGEYHIGVTGIIINSKNDILISKRALHKKFGGMWELNGGAVLKGETSLEGILRELKEELGLEFSKREAIFYKSIKREIVRFTDYWIFKKDVDLDKIRFVDGETTDVKWVNINEFKDMCKNDEIVQSDHVIINEYDKIIKTNQKESYDYLGKNVEVVIDRKLGTNHPKHGFLYEVNYGYVPNTVSGDGEELDCYVLGVDEPVEKFVGTCTAVILRFNDNDDKLVVVPESYKITDENIRKLTYFQEQYFDSAIIR